MLALSIGLGAGAAMVACNLERGENPAKATPEASADEVEAEAKAGEPSWQGIAARPPAGEPQTMAPSHGFGEGIAWRGLEEGLKEAAAEGKGMMLLVHASWCSKCKQLKPSFFDPNLVTASRDLVMVNVDQDEEPRSMVYAPDGTYIPRVLFIGPDGEVVSELKNGQRPRYHYFYTPADDLVGMMKQAASRYGRS